MGLGGQEVAGKVVTVQTELPSDIDGILDAVREILMLGGVQSITLRDGHPIVYQRFVLKGEELRPEETSLSFAEMTPFDVVRSAEMDEWSSEDKKTPEEKLIWMFADMSIRGWTVTHILLSEASLFWSWLGVSTAMRSIMKQFLGARIELDKMVPNNVFLLCGSKSRNAAISDIGFVLKGVCDE